MDTLTGPVVEELSEGWRVSCTCGAGRDFASDLLAELYFDSHVETCGRLR